MPSACESDCCVTVRNASLFHMPKACLYLQMKEILIKRFNNYGIGNSIIRFYSDIV